MWETRVTRMLGIQYPIIQGAYGGFGTSAIAAPAAEAGALGIITCSALRTPERLREDLRRMRSLTSKPFAINLSPGTPQADVMLEVAIEEGVRVLETAGMGADRFGLRMKEAGGVWLHKMATVRHALAAERQGADAVTIVGIEGAGVKSPIQITTLSHLPLAVRALKVPVIAAGGLGDGRGLMGALALGAEAIYLGTALIATTECPVPQTYKDKIVAASSYDPDLRNRIFAPPGTDEMARFRRGPGGGPTPPPEPQDIEDVIHFYGFSLAAGLIDRVVPVKDFIQGIIAEAEAIRRRWALG